MLMTNLSVNLTSPEFEDHVSFWVVLAVCLYLYCQSCSTVIYMTITAFAADQKND